MHSNVAETIMFDRYKLLFSKEDHPSRENSHYIDEMLMLDNESEKYLEEYMFEGNQIAVLKSFLLKVKKNYWV